MMNVIVQSKIEGSDVYYALDTIALTLKRLETCTWSVYIGSYGYEGPLRQKMKCA